MARYEFKLPDIGEGVTEGEVVTWHVKVGDRVVEDQLMVEVMTDKATVTIGAPKGGRIDSLAADVGAVVKVGDVLVVIQTGNGSKIHGALPANPAGGPVASAVGDIQEALPGTRSFVTRPPGPLGGTLCRSTVMSRASLRVAGVASGLSA